MSGLNPSGTKWSVASMDDKGVIGNFHPTPWEFNDESMNAGALWAGGYRPIEGSQASFACEIIGHDAESPTDSFEVHFVTSERFIATKNDNLYRFGKKL